MGRLDMQAILAMTERRTRDVTILDLDGRLQAGGAALALRGRLDALLGDGRRKVLLNLARLQAVDASGIGALLHGLAAQWDAGGDLKLMHVPANVRKILTVLGLIDFFTIVDSEDEAVAGFSLDPRATDPLERVRAVVESHAGSLPA